MSVNINRLAAWSSPVCNFPLQPKPDKLSHLDFVIAVNKAVNDGIDYLITPEESFRRMNQLFEENPALAESVYPNWPKEKVALKEMVIQFVEDFRGWREWPKAKPKR